MDVTRAVSRRGFVGVAAAGLAYLGYRTGGHTRAGELIRGAMPGAPAAEPLDEYDALAKLSFNENPWGPSQPVLDAMTRAYKYSSRYGYPDGGITSEIATHHGVKRENIMLGAGSGEILSVVGHAYLTGGKAVVGVTPTYDSVYSHASGIRAEAIRLPLPGDYGQDIPAMIAAVKQQHRRVGFVYLCNPNNPTGRIVTSAEVRQLLDGIPEDVPVLIDEAYHHYVEDPAYSTSIPYVLEGRPVIVARTFSKIYGMAGLRLGYAVAPPQIIARMRPWSTGSMSALVKWGGVAALRDREGETRVRTSTLALRKETTAQLEGMGFRVIPSEANFFMVDLGRPVRPVIDEFRKQGVAVGRPFPPMNQHLRVSIGTPGEMQRFTTAFQEIVATRRRV